MILKLLPRDLREPIEGDLAEEAAAIRTSRGRAAAAVWFWWQATRLALRFWVERLRHGRPLPPIGDAAPLATTWIDGLRQDAALAIRTLRRHPSFAIVSVVALTLGIGATTAIVTIVDAVLWRPLPFPDAGRIVSISEQRTREHLLYGAVSPADFLDWRASSRSFAAMASVTDFALNLTGGIEPQRLRALAVSPGFLDVLGVSPSLGRAFRIDDEELGRHRVVIISDGLWRSAFGGRPDLVGAMVQLNAEPYQIVGILPRTFWWTSHPDVLVPRAFEADERTLRAVHMFSVVARLAPGVSVEQARADMDAIGRRLAAEHPTENRYHLPFVAPLRDAFVSDVRQPLMALFGAVLLVLLIACANVSTLTVARSTARRKEIAIRLALGAGRVRVARTLLTESVLVAALGGAFAVLLAWWTVALAGHLLPPQLLALPGLDHLTLDRRVLALAVAISSGATLLFGIVPAVSVSGDHASAVLADAGRGGTTGITTRRVRTALIISEMALSVMLLVGAGLLMISFHRLLDVSPGFQVNDVVTMRVTLPVATYSRPSRVVQFYDDVLSRLRRSAGIEAAAAVTLLPFSGADQRGAFQIEGRTDDSGMPVRARPIAISEGYLAAMRIGLVSGRSFSDRDREGSTAVAIINSAAARRYWPGANPIGRRISFEFDPPRWLEIVGVAGDVKHRGLASDADPEVYLSYRQPAAVGSTRAMTIVVRTPLPLDAAAPLMRRAVNEVDRNQPVGAVRRMEDLVGDSVAPQRLNLWLVVAFAAVALVLTAEGVYGVMAYLVVQRTRELAVRVALGAAPLRILSLVLGQAGLLAAAGIAIGLAVAAAASRAVAGLLFGVNASTAWVYAGVAGILAVVALAATAAPAVRAARIDPLVALRDDR